jgi:uncharacterized glyoxalase superfamily protein PhnB
VIHRIVPNLNVRDATAGHDFYDAEARGRGYEIVHPLTEEPWGPRRFFVRDPNGVVVNVVGHPD